MATTNSVSLNDARKAEQARKKLFSDPQFEPFQKVLARGGKIDAGELPLDMQDALGIKDGLQLRLVKGGKQELLDAQSESVKGNYQRAERLNEIASMVGGSQGYRAGRAETAGRVPVADLAQIPALVPQVQVEPQGVPSGREVSQSEIVGRKPGIKGVVNALIPEDVKRATNKFSEEFTFALSPILDTILRANQKDVVGTATTNAKGETFAPATGQTVGVGNQVVEQLQRLMSDTKKSANKQLNKATGAQTAEEEILQALKEDPTFKDIFAGVNKSKSAPRTIQDIAKMGGTGVRRTKAGRAYQITADGKLILQ